MHCFVTTDYPEMQSKYVYTSGTEVFRFPIRKNIYIN